MPTKTIKKNPILLDNIHAAILDMMKKVKFDPIKHIYTRVDDGSWLQGVSTVSSIIPKDWLSAWGAKECAKFLGYSDYEGDTERAIEILVTITSFTDDEDTGGVDGTPIIKGKTKEEKFIELLKEAKGASGRKSKTALVDGTAGHAWLESWVKAKIRGTTVPKIPTGPLQRPLKQFVKWANDNVAYWILSEARVAYPEKGYAGTLDGLAMMKTGKLAIIDFKFASHISEDYYLQTSGYQATFEPYGVKIDERIIVRLPKTLEREEYDKVTHKYTMVANDLEVQIVPTEYELDRDTFFHCLPVKKWINQFEEKKKYVPKKKKVAAKK